VEASTKQTVLLHSGTHVTRGKSQTLTLLREGFQIKNYSFVVITQILFQNSIKYWLGKIWASITTEKQLIFKF